jgi:maltooligosyltrehalose trehalohydrolase
MRGQVIYEMHVGTFTPEGTWKSAASKLPLVARTGITVLELMPVSEFPGQFGWGYDGVFPYAPTRLYGRPDDFRAFVDAAHGLGLAVILDVVYNHLGPDGCVFAKYSPDYFGHSTEWGEGLNFDGRNSGPVREFFSANAAYWIDEYHLDGLRLDATQSIHDASDDHMLAVIGRRARAAAGTRQIILVAENERQEVRLIRSLEEGGYGLDALWNDDFHHSARVALTGEREAYFSDHRGTAQEFVSAAKHGYLFQGQRYAWQKQARGTRTNGVEPWAFVNFIENHDQLANCGDGSRMHQTTTPGRYRAMSALFILMPGTPMLFQGQEFGASAPFRYFADHRPELAAAVQKGRAEFLSQFPSLASEEMQHRLPPPHDPHTFESTILDWTEYDTHVQHRRLYEDLLVMRRTDRAFVEQQPGRVDGAVLAPEAFVLAVRDSRAGRRAAASGQFRFRAHGRIIRRTSDGAARRLHLARAMVEPEPRLWRAWDARGRRNEWVERSGAFCSRAGADAMTVIDRTDADLVRADPLGTDAGRSSVAGVQGVAGHQRPWRLCHGNGLRGHHPPVPQPARGRAANPVRPHGDAQ